VQWFSDAQHLLICGTEAGRRPRCYRTDLDGTAFTPVTDEGVQAALAPNGTTLLLTTNDGVTRLASIGQAQSRPVTALGAGDRLVGWSRDSTAVYVQRGFEVPVRIERVTLATDQRALVKTLAPEGIGDPASIFVADWVDDGRAYAYNYTTVPSVLFVVTGAQP
jgi:hypothetical protein